MGAGRRERSWRRVTLPAVLAAAGALLIAPAARANIPDADALEGWPESSWPVCADETSQYCVASATVTPTGGAPTPVAALGLSASVSTLPGVATSLNWAVSGWAGESVAAETRDGDVELVVRVGQFVPRYTLAIARGLRVERAGDDNGNTTLTITGNAVEMNWIAGDDPLFATCVAGSDCGNENTMANSYGSGLAFSGNTQDLATWGEDYMTAMDGMYIATNAQARPNFLLIGTYPSLYWYMPTLGNPHLTQDGVPARGSFNAWMPPSFFTAAGTTASEAAGVGFDVSIGTGESSVSVPATVAQADGGVAVDVEDIPFSVHTVTVSNQAPTVDPEAAAPDSPEGVAVASAVGGVTASWTVPEDADASYVARAFTAQSGGTIAGSCTSDEGSCTITGLSTGTTYYVAVSAVNELGEGDPAARIAGTPATAPSAPRAVAVVAGPERLQVTWTAPASTGGRPVTGYTARAYAASTGGSPLRACTAAASARTCILSPLTDGTRYWVDVRATNDAGTSGASAPRVSGVPRTRPSAPRAVYARSAERRIKVGWTAPASNGGSAITGYQVQLFTTSAGGSPAVRCSAAPAARICQTGALPKGKVYWAAVLASNAAGWSPPSTPRVKVVVA